MSSDNSSGIDDSGSGISDDDLEAVGATRASASDQDLANAPRSGFQSKLVGADSLYSAETEALANLDDDEDLELMVVRVPDSFDIHALEGVEIGLPSSSERKRDKRRKLGQCTQAGESYDLALVHHAGQTQPQASAEDMLHLTPLVPSLTNGSKTRLRMSSKPVAYGIIVEPSLDSPPVALPKAPGRHHKRHAQPESLPGLFDRRESNANQLKVQEAWSPTYHSQTGGDVLNTHSDRQHQSALKT
ncbi:uncharacterized protein L969DRAFT_96233 [Mixia osmundae IAM 14324]|uniref:Uncharacterized protein n=1 Tax=Mixia osmundae (strain CBS 9802 / IAM 14324 / JCM 22182 / KY 12970) TaxID=764103 RepID=G7E4U2_MIXOS|nr:uncharacterized protein L969DRAFT_96233 [Mixia osmundae IAM 14324]KEI37715.1 hypothetical protein L969DRAFT_96233 [Mixia osmundae IAM 14324]GAA97852.1 hypothetical protein E5Q_04532 [Mixia osmundae IAM 14324]